MIKRITLVMLLSAMLLVVSCGVKDQKGDLGNIGKINGEIESKVQEMVSVPDKETFSTPVPTPLPTPTPIPTPSPTPKPKGDVPEKSYASRNDFPYGNMELVDDATYAFLKEVYGKIDFSGEFEKGNEELYDSYLKKYKQVIDSEMPFTVMETGEMTYVKDYVRAHSYYYPSGLSEDKFTTPHVFMFSLFDMDGDDTPELVMWRQEKYVFKYLEETDEVVLWLEISIPYETIQGSAKLLYEWEGRYYTLTELDENAERSMELFFVIEWYLSNGNVAYMLTLPEYTNENKKIELTYEQKKNAYFAESEQCYFFPVSEAQFEELVGDFFKQNVLSHEKIKAVSYSYDDLFNQGELCVYCNDAVEYLNNQYIVVYTDK